MFADGSRVEPGETIYSAIVAHRAGRGASGLRPGCLERCPRRGHWLVASQVPDVSGKKLARAANDVMLHYFEELAGQTGKQDVRYALALLMVRRRILRLEENGKNEQGHDLLKLFCPRPSVKRSMPSRPQCPTSRACGKSKPISQRSCSRPAA